MERKKQERSDQSFPNEANKLFSQYKQKVSLEHSQSINDSLFFKYASSIIQVVPEDKLDRDDRNGTLLEHTDTIYESSELNYYETESALAQVEPHAEEQNTYNEVRFKMKKKYPNKQLLVYNFSNFTCFTSNLNHVFKKSVRLAFQAIRTAAHPNEHAKLKKDKKKTSFYSAYTTSTNSDQKMLKIQCGRMADVRRHEQLQDAAHRIMGWVEFKQMILASSAFKEIFDWAKSRLSHTKKMSSTIKNDIPLSNFCLSDYQNDQSLSIARDMPDHIEESLVYTADHNFQFSEKQMTITTPEKYAYQHDRNQSLNLKLKGSEAESVVSSYRPTPKSPPSVMSKPMKKDPIDYKTMATVKPIVLSTSEERRYLVLRTNMYELPLITNQDLRPQIQTRMKQLPINVDYLLRSEPESPCDMIENTIKELEQAIHTLSIHNSSRSPENKSIESSFNSKDNNIQASNASGYVSNSDKLSKIAIDNSKTQTEKGTFGSRAAVRSHNQKIEQLQEHKRVQSINYGISSSRDKKNIENNYYSGTGTETSAKVLDRYTSELRSPDMNKGERKQMGDQVRSVDSYINIVPNQQQKKDKKRPIFQENAVKNYVISEKVEKKEIVTGSPPVRRQEYQRVEERRMEYGSKGMNLGLNLGEKKVNNAPKMNIMVTSPRKIQQNVPPTIQINPPRRVQINLVSPRPQQRQVYISNTNQMRPQSPRTINPDIITIKPKIQSANQISSKEKVQSPTNNNIYQLNHGLNLANRQFVPQPQQQKVIHTQDPRPLQQVIYQQPINHNNQQQMHLPQQLRAGIQGQTRIQTIVRNSNRVGSPSPSNNIQYHPQHSQSPLIITKKQQPIKKPAMNLPQILHRQVYTQLGSKSPEMNKPQSPPYHIRMMSQPSQQYFLKEQHNHLQAKAVNFNNNYYTTGVVPKMVAPMAQANRNVFQQQMDAETRRKKCPIERPATSVRQSTDRTNLFSNYSPIDSQVEGPQRSNHFSRNSSQISRPKSMNEKIHLTLRRDK